MASSSLTLYKNNTQTQVFDLQQTSAMMTKWIASGRSLSTPYFISVERKLANANSSSNDHIILRAGRTEANASTAKLATSLVTLDVSVPKDQSILTPTVQKELLSLVASALNEATAMEATSANITKLIEGRDL